jgi:hypothetical protein
MAERLDASSRPAPYTNYACACLWFINFRIPIIPNAVRLMRPLRSAGILSF